MNYLEKPYQDFKDYSIDYYKNKSFELDIDYMDGYYGESKVTLDALAVYKHLKKYFKGTKHE